MVIAPLKLVDSRKSRNRRFTKADIDQFVDYQRIASI